MDNHVVWKYSVPEAEILICGLVESRVLFFIGKISQFTLELLLLFKE